MDRIIDIGEFVEVTTPEKIKILIRDNAQKRRKAKKISQKSLAELSKVSYASIRRFEKCGEISLNSLIKISMALDCIDDFRAIFSHPVLTNLKDYEP